MQNSSQFLEAYLNYLKEENIENTPQELYEPVNYIMSLGGKRMRPTLVLWGSYCFCDKPESALPVAHAAEVFHNFTLVHDDIMDEAPLRRGKATVHEKYDLNTAILSGDVMLLKSYEYLMKVEKKSQFRKLAEIFNRVAIEVCEGQQMDMNFETRSDVSIKEYLKMIELKTAALLGGAIRLGAMVGGANRKNAGLIEKFARTMGVAFQIQDDLLDTFGDPEKFGKQVGGDILQNKKTYLYLTALKAARGNQKKELKKLYFSKSDVIPDKVERVRSIFKDLNIVESTQVFQNKLIEKGYSFLEKVEAPADRKEALKIWAEKLVVRQV